MEHFRTLGPAQRANFLSSLMSELSETELSRLYRDIYHRLRVDPLDVLPADITNIIFGHLDPESLCACELVSKKWHQRILHADFWRLSYNRAVANNPDWQEFLFRLGTGRTNPCRPPEWRLAYLAIKKALARIAQNWEFGRTANGTIRRTDITCQGDGVYCLQFDQNKIMTGDRRNQIKIWSRNDHATSYRLDRAITGHTGSVLCLQFDDVKIITASSDSTIRIWNLATYACVRVIRRHEESVLHVRFDDKRMVTCSKDKKIIIWNKADELGFDWREFKILEGHRAAVNVVEFDSSYIVSASGDRTLKVWSAPTGDLVRNLTGHDRGIACIHFRGRHIVSGSSDQSIRVWDIDRDHEIRVLRGHQDLVRCVRFDERFIVSGSYDATIRVWDFHSGRQLNKLEGHASRVFRIQYDGLKIVSSSQDDSIIVWDFAGPTLASFSTEDEDVEMIDEA